jgi:4-amino-4-deoxy-L-arabinose transferase-like glycosyltransferase
VVAFAAATLFIAPSWVSNLGPQPDAIEYALTAQRLAHFKSFSLVLLGHEYPPHYPFGFPAYLAPAYWLPGATLASGIHGVFLAGVGAAVLTYALGRRLGGTLAGVAGAVTLLLRPKFVQLNHVIMTESLSAALAVLVGVLLHVTVSFQGRRRRQCLFLLSAACGFAILVRYTNLVLTVGALVGLLSYYAVGAERSSSRASGRLSEVFLLCSGPILAISALAIYQQLTFGSFLMTGYNFWLPTRFGAPSSTFSLRYAFGAPINEAVSLVGYSPNAVFYASYLASWVSSPLLLLPTVFGALILFRRRDHPSVAVAWYVAVCGLLFYVLYSLYWFQAGRFLAPLFPLAAALSGVGLQHGLWAAREQKAHGFVVVVLWCAGAIATVPQVTRQSYVVQHYVGGRTKPQTFPLLARSVEAYASTSPDAIMVTAIPLPWLDRRRVRDRRIIPLVRRSFWTHPMLARVGTLAEQQEVVDIALKRGAPVYTDVYSLTQVQDNPAYQAERRAIEGYELVPVQTSVRNGHVLLYRLHLKQPENRKAESPS